MAAIQKTLFVFFRELDKKTICYIQRFSNSTNSENIVFFPENYLRHIDSGDISLVNGKTEGIDGMIKTTFPLLHDFLFLFSECLICFALKNCSGMNECMIRCSYQINVLTCQTVSHSLVKSILLSTLSRHYKRLAYDF